MPKSTGFLVGEFLSHLTEALEIAQAAEGSSSFLYTRRLYVYEAAYLLAFSAWENLLEQSFLRFLCGYIPSSGLAPTPTTTWLRPISVSAATVLILGGRSFRLWHNPRDVISRARGYFVSGPHETVLNSALADIEDFAAIRHYVAHRNDDTRQKFQTAAIRLSGSRVLGARAGRLLRSETMDPVTMTKVTWLERICADLERYARQISS